MSRPACVLLLAALLAACGGNDESPGLPDGGLDAGADGGGADAGRDGGTDGGDTGDAGVSPCARSVQAVNGPYSLLEELKLALARAPSGDARRAAVDRFVEVADAAGGAPLVSDALASSPRVAFFVRGEAFAGSAVAGAFNGWSPTATPLLRLRDTDLFVAEVVVPRTGPQPYKLVRNGTFDLEYEDARAHHVVRDNLNRGAPGRFNALVYPDLQPATEGRLTAWRDVRSTTLGDARDVFIYTPAVYDAADCPSLPSLYFQDGNESLTRESFAHVADAHYAARPGDAAVLVFVALPTRDVPADVRFAQYSFPPKHPGGMDWPEPRGDAYVAFLKDELVPKVDAAFRTRRAREERGVAGISLGGLISVYAGFTASDAFGFVGTQSGSLFFPHQGGVDDIDKNDLNAMVERAKRDPKVPVRFYVDHGAPDNGVCVSDNGGDDCQSNLLFRDALQSRGYDFAHVVEAGGKHDWPYWKKRLPKLLCFFRHSKSACGL
ncbi:alpha/beta hydrolase-fold protein [Myxococcaceae bacterium GXIMD 01537]